MMTNEYHLTWQQLRWDLYVAYFCARKGKRKRAYVRYFERDLDKNLDELCDELWNRTYRPQPSTCFIVERPKKREVFAAQFRDRIVHHLYFNYTHQLFEATFIQDTYSCIERRGTHYGIKRLARHVRSCSENYQHPAYVMKLDKRGYFMHIHRPTLLSIATRQIERMAGHYVPRDCAVAGARPDGSQPRLRWRQVIDVPFLLWLTREIVMLDPKENCRIVGSVRQWDDLDHAKSLFYTLDDCGLPIGNLTSQLLSNVYLNEFDQFVKRTLKCRHYGRYVDDSFIVSRDAEHLRSLVPEIRRYLKEELHLDLHFGKLHIIQARQGVEFLGGYVKPRRTYPSSQSLRRMEKKVKELEQKALGLRIRPGEAHAVARSLNSYLGILCHYASFNVRARLFLRLPFLQLGTFDRQLSAFTLAPHLADSVSIGEDKLAA